MPFIQKHWFLIIVVLATTLAYSNTFYADYQFDDLRVILNDGFIKDFSNFGKLSTWTNNILRPLSLFTLSLNYKFHGVSVGGFHLVNLIIHLTNIVLLYILTNQLNRECKLNWNKHLRYIPVIIFALHPIQTQAVTYLVQRMTSQSVLFYLLSLTFYFAYRKAIEHNKYFKTALLLFAIVISIIASFLSKQIGITAGLTILGFETFLYGYFNKPKSLIIPTAGFTVFISIVVFAFITDTLPKTNIDYSRFEYLIAQLNALPIYFKLLFTGIGLNIDHYRSISNTSTLFISLGLVFYITTTLALFLKINRFIKATILFFIASMLIESSIIPIKDIIVDHRMYLPIIPIVLLFTYILNHILRNNQIRDKISVSIIIFFTLILSISSFYRNKVWENKITLWESSLNENPTNTRALNNLAQAHMLEGDFSKAQKILKKAILINPSYAIIHSNISICYAYINEFSNSEIHLAKFKQLSKNKAKLNYCKAIIEYKRNELIKAEKYFQKVIKYKKRHYLAHEKLIDIYGMKLETKKKDKQIQILRQLNPDYFVIKEKMHLTF